MLSREDRLQNALWRYITRDECDCEGEDDVCHFCEAFLALSEDAREYAVDQELIELPERLRDRPEDVQRLVDENYGHYEVANAG
jgi:hypothetical protein